MSNLNFHFTSDFCKKELIEQSFARKVARLNTNILYLCYTQRVKLNTLSPGHTLENIEKLLNLEYSDLGRIGAVDINDSFSGTMDFQLMKDLLSAGDSGSEEGIFHASLFDHFIKLRHDLQWHPFDIFFSDENALPTEWEAVSHPHQPPEILFPTQLQNPQQTASIAGGLVTSAVQSVASIWRVFTTGK